MGIVNTDRNVVKFGMSFLRGEWKDRTRQKYTEMPIKVLHTPTRDEGKITHGTSSFPDMYIQTDSREKETAPFKIAMTMAVPIKC